MMVQTAFLAIAAYFVGSIPTAYLIARWRRGIDIRRFGSGNVGASNVLETVSKGWSVFVTAIDIAKGALMVWLAGVSGLGTADQVIVGLAAIIGHNWTIFLHFQGGRGIFTSFGVITMLAPRVGPIALVLPYLFAPFHQLSLGVLVTLILLPVLSYTLSGPLAIADPSAVSLGYVAIMAIAVARRLTAPKSPLSDTVSRGELISNRLLFDRDIRDRETWITRNAPQGKP